MSVADTVAKLRPATTYFANLCHKTEISRVVRNRSIPNSSATLPASTFQGNGHGSSDNQRAANAFGPRQALAQHHCGEDDYQSHAELIDRSEEHTSELQSLRHLVCR